MSQLPERFHCCKIKLYLILSKYLMEQPPKQFNKATFEQSLEDILQEYYTDYLRVGALAMDGSEYKKSHQLTFNNLLDKIVPILTETIKSQQNQQGILNSLHKCIEEVGAKNDYDEMENPFSTDRTISLLEAIILKLLNK